MAADCYRMTQSFPREEAFGMTSQIRRSAVSIAANIAEGWGRDGTGSFVQFLKIAQGSLKELETHLLLSERVGLVGVGKIAPLLARRRSREDASVLYSFSSALGAQAMNLSARTTDD